MNCQCALPFSKSVVRGRQAEYVSIYVLHVYSSSLEYGGSIDCTGVRGIDDVEVNELLPFFSMSNYIEPRCSVAPSQAFNLH